MREKCKVQSNKKQKRTVTSEPFLFFTGKRANHSATRQQDRKTHMCTCTETVTNNNQRFERQQKAGVRVTGRKDGLTLSAPAVLAELRQQLQLLLVFLFFRFFSDAGTKRTVTICHQTCHQCHPTYAQSLSVTIRTVTVCHCHQTYSHYLSPDVQSLSVTRRTVTVTKRTVTITRSTVTSCHQTYSYYVTRRTVTVTRRTVTIWHQTYSHYLAPN